MQSKNSSGPGAAGAAEGRRERKKRETRARILETARTLFLDRGYAETTVADIGRELDLSTQTVFNYFPTKDRLLLAMAEAFEGLMAMIGQEGSETFANVQRFLGPQGIVIAQVGAVRRELYVEVLRVILSEQAGHDMLRRVHAAIERVLARSQSLGEARTDLPAGLLAQMVVNTMIGAVTTWLADPHARLDERLRECVVFLHEAIKRR